MGKFIQSILDSLKLTDDDDFEDLKKDIDMSDIKIQEDEVEYVEWLSKDKINELIKNNEFREGNIEGYKYIISNMNTQ